MKQLFKTKFVQTLGIILVVFAIATMQSCKKEEPVVIDPNLSKYKVEALQIKTTKDEDLNAITNISSAGTNDFKVDAIVPDDGNEGKWFKIAFTFPDGITPTSITPSIADSIDFSIAKTFTITYTPTEVKTYTVTIVEQAPEAPVIVGFTIPGAEQTVVDPTTLRVNVRMPQGANVSNITPKITLSPNTAIVVGGEKAYNFADIQTVLIKNGALTRQYTINVTDYGFTKVTTILDRSLNGKARPGAYAAAGETSIAFDETGQNVFVSNADGIKKFSVSSATSNGTDLNMIHADNSKAPSKVLQRVGKYLLSGNAVWQGGNVEISAWDGTGSGDKPVLLAKVPIPTNAIFQNFTAFQSGTNIIVNVVDRNPLRLSSKADPAVYTIEIPIANIASGALINTFKTNAKLNGLVASGLGDGPNAEFHTIPNSSEYVYNSGTTSPIFLNSTFGSPISISSALLNSSSVGVKMIEHNRGKYIAYGVFSWSTNLANPKASKFIVLDMTKKGFRTTAADVNNEFANKTYGTWNAIQKIDIGMGGEFGDSSSGGYYCQTATAVTAAGKLRIACVSAGNGFVVVECD